MSLEESPAKARIIVMGDKVYAALVVATERRAKDITQDGTTYEGYRKRFRSKRNRFCG